MSNVWRILFNIGHLEFIHGLDIQPREYKHQIFKLNLIVLDNFFNKKFFSTKFSEIEKICVIKKVNCELVANSQFLLNSIGFSKKITNIRQQFLLIFNISKRAKSMKISVVLISLIPEKWQKMRSTATIFYLDYYWVNSRRQGSTSSINH